MQSERPSLEKRVLLLAATRRDAQACCSLLGDIGVECFACDDLPTLCAEINKGAASVLLPEETILADPDSRLAQILRQQPVWSDLPIIVLSGSGAESVAADKVLDQLSNATLLERPMRISTLISVTKTALRARERQYQLRDHLAERERTEREIREAWDVAERANRSKEQFLAALSHELRTPLTPAMMAIASLDSEPALPEQFRDDVAMIKRNISLEARLIDDLLDLSRITTGKLPLQLHAVDLHEVLHNVIEICRSDVNSKKLELALDFSAPAFHASVDPTRIQQVFWNLMKNSVKFTRDGGKITVCTRQVADGRIAIAISDTGIGIDADLLPKVFNAFEQGDTAMVHQFGGLGLGLAISKSLIEMQGGAIGVTSPGRDQGATFTVELPITSDFSAKSSPDRVPVRGANGSLKRVLVVEDNADTARMLGRLLKTLGYHVGTANSVSSALEKAASESYDVLISDLGLPDASGYELMREMRDRYGVPGIALSGYGMEDDLRRSQEAGFKHHLVKPVDFRQLELAISRLTDGPQVAAADSHLE